MFARALDYHVVTIGVPEMMNSIWVALVVLGCPLFWIMIVVPLIAKCFSVPYKIGVLPFSGPNQRLGKWQSFWFAGVLGWGGCVFLFGALILHFSGSTMPRIQSLLFVLVWCLFLGGLLSLWNTSRRPT